jgi:hypothetical protein
MKRFAILHRSQSEYGTAWHVNEWHRQRGWGAETAAGKIACGYSWIVLNGKLWSPARYDATMDGKLWSPARYDATMDGAIVPGRPPGVAGAHCKGWNSHPGICYIGNAPSYEQRLSLLVLCRSLWEQNVIDDVLGHDEARKRSGRPAKGCPNMDMDTFRKILDLPQRVRKP